MFFYDFFQQEDAAQSFCARKNAEPADNLQPYRYAPLYTAPPATQLQQAVARARQEGRDECRTACEELLALSARQAKDGDPFEIGREAAHAECIEAIRAKGTHD